MSSQRRAVHMSLLLLALLVAACSDSPLVPEGIASIQLSTSAVELQMGDTHPLSAVVRDTRGSVRHGAPVTWASQNPAVAIVSATGLVSAVGPGTTAITASAGGKHASASFTVVAPITSVEIEPSTLQLTFGQTHQLHAIVKDAAGRTRDDVAINWQSSDASIVSVSASGVVSALQPTTEPAVITATAAEHAGITSVSVDAPISTVEIRPQTLDLAVGTSAALEAIVKDAAGRHRPEVEVAWETSSVTVATVAATGVSMAIVTGVGEGQALIRATAAGVTSTALIGVTARPLMELAHEVAFSFTLADGTAVAIGFRGTIPLYPGVEWQNGAPIVFGKGGMQYDHMTVTAPAGSLCTATAVTTPGNLEAVFGRHYPGNAGKLAGRLVPATALRPREMITWSCGGNTMLQPVHWVAMILEEIYGKGLMTDFEAIGSGRQRIVYERMHETSLATVREIATYLLTELP